MHLLASALRVNMVGFCGDARVPPSPPPHTRTPASVFFTKNMFTQRGSVYSLDESRRSSWTQELQSHVNNLREGKGESGQRFSYRLTGSAVADVHRTLVRAETERYGEIKRERDQRPLLCTLFALHV